MILAIALPQTPAVDLSFAFDLANLVGHIATTYPEVSVRLLMAPDGDPLAKEDFIESATGAGADLVVFMNEQRFRPDQFDRMLNVALSPPPVLPKNADLGLIAPAPGLN